MSHASSSLGFHSCMPGIVNIITSHFMDATRHNFIVLHILSVPPAQFFPPLSWNDPGNHWPFPCVSGSAFSRMSLSGIIPFAGSQTGFFHQSALCVYGSSMSLAGLTVHFFLLLNNMPLYESTTVCLSTFEGHFGYFQFLIIMIKGAVNIYVRVFVWTWSFSCFE